MSLRLSTVTDRGAAIALGALLTGALGLPAGAAAAGLGPIAIGGSSSPGAGLPSVEIEVPSPSKGSAPIAEVGVGGEGAKVTTPVTGTAELHTPTVTTTPAPKVEVPPPKVELPKVETPKVETPRVEVPKTPGVPPVSVSPAEAGTGGGAGSGSKGAAGSSSPASSAHSAATGAARPDGVLASRGSGKGSGGGRSGGAVKAGGGAAGTAGTTGPGPSTRGASGTAAKSAGGGAVGPAAKRTSGGAGDPLSSLGASLPLPLPVPDWSKPIILLLALLALAFGARWWLASRRARALERRQDALLRDIEVMQAALVPEVPARIQSLEVSVSYRPAEGPAAGGDFYDVFELGPDRVAVILGDVAGHGHDAVRRAALTRYTLRAFLKETAEPRAALGLAGHALSEPGFEQLATVAIAVFDSSHGTLTYALAGHPPPLLLGVPAADAPLQCSSPPVGCELPTGRRQRTVSLPPGARACLFSDGLIEARCGAPGDRPHELLGRERLVEMFAALPAESGARDLLGAVREAASATPDDMAACILISRASGARRAIDSEVLEIDRRTLADGHLAGYLRAGGLSETDAERVLRTARKQLVSHETAVLIVDRSRGDAEVTVRAGRAREPERTPTGRREPRSGGLLRA
jgi:serine phosphatase RsbU (regulator of sigma subunit)